MVFPYLIEAIFLFKKWEKKNKISTKGYPLDLSYFGGQNIIQDFPLLDQNSQQLIGDLNAQGYHIRLLASCEKLRPFIWSKVTCGKNSVGNTQLLRLPFPLQQSPILINFQRKQLRFHNNCESTWACKGCVVTKFSNIVPSFYSSSTFPLPTFQIGCWHNQSTALIKSYIFS